MGDTKPEDSNVDELRGRLDGVCLDLVEILEQVSDKERLRMRLRVHKVLLRSIYGDLGDESDSELPF